MDDSRWRAIEGVFHDAHEVTPAERGAFLDRACAGDESLRREVESLLAHAEAGHPLLDPDPAPSPEPTAPVLAPNTPVGPYRVVGLAGTGGMGRVYRAHDARLDRFVAIKFVHPRFMTRFAREARAIAALNHPHICTLHDVGPDYLVMEWLDGETLRDRLRRGPLSLAELCPAGGQIAEALAHAHARGIIHRDLKPANVMLTPTGVKVLDFGLAKPMTATPDEAPSGSGAVLGTPNYMSPEQRAGGAVGPATDLFALGLMLFEMAEGHLPAPGVSIGSAWVARTPIVVPSLSGRGGRGLTRLIRQLVEPQAERRLATAGTVRHRLDELARPPRRGRRWLAAAGLAALVVAAVALFERTRGPETRLVPTRIDKITSFPGNETDPAFSPDGRVVAFSWNGPHEDNYDIYVLPLGESAPRRLTTDPGNDMSPAWSPDGRQLAFMRVETVSRGTLMVVPVEGGAERAVRDVALSENMYRVLRPLLTWTPDGASLVYSAQEPESGRTSLYVTDLAGRSARKLFNVESEASWGVTAPALSRDGGWLAYVDAAGPQTSRVFVRKVGPGLEVSAEAIPVSAPTHGRRGSPVWSPDGSQLLFQEESAILDWRRGRTAEQVYVGANVLAAFAATWPSTGPPRLVIAEEPSRGFQVVPLRQGGLEAAGPPTPFATFRSEEYNPQFSPDGRWFACVAVQDDDRELWVTDAEGGHPRPLTHLHAQTMGFPRWSADSRHLAFHAWTTGKAQVYTLAVGPEPGGPDDQLAEITHAPLGFFTGDWTRDGQTLFIIRASGDPPRMFRVAATGGDPEALFEGGPGVTSADGRMLIYGKAGRAGLFTRSLDGDPASQPEARLLEDYKSPGADLNPVADGLYYVSWEGEGHPRYVRFYSYARHTSVNVVSIPAPTRTIAGLAVSPDRTRLVYEVVSGMDLSVVDFR